MCPYLPHSLWALNDDRRVYFTVLHKQFVSDLCTCTCVFLLVYICGKSLKAQHRTAEAHCQVPTSVKSLLSCQLHSSFPGYPPKYHFPSSFPVALHRPRHVISHPARVDGENVFDPPWLHSFSAKVIWNFRLLMTRSHWLLRLILQLMASVGGVTVLRWSQ
jgi:hypothetical protein